MKRDLAGAIAEQYARPRLLEAVLAALEEDGHANPTPDTLAAVDEFHTAGRVATLRALSLIQFRPDMRVIDAGCGLGGAARLVAVKHLCHVSGLDLTPEYIEVATALSELMGISHLCRFHVGNVLDMPFGNASFDVGMTFHVAMNIDDRARFYSELYRVLRPSARLCIFDVMKGPTIGMEYPVPWANSADISFLRTLEETIELLAAAGFSTEIHQSFRFPAMSYYRIGIAGAARSNQQHAVGLHLLTGSHGHQKLNNYVCALERHQIDPMFIVAAREGPS